MSKDAEGEFEVPPEQDPPAQEEPAAPAGDACAPTAPAVGVSAGGLRVGDFVMRVVPAMGTDSTHDNVQNEERARAREDDARAAQHAGAGPVEGAPGPSPDGSEDAPPDVPILLRDPLTGQPIGTL
jgi:hypothetical protein